MTHEVNPHVICHACGACFDRKAWSILALVERIEPGEAQRVLADWPNEQCIEIRHCRCAREIVARVMPSSASGDAMVPKPIRSGRSGGAP